MTQTVGKVYAEALFQLAQEEHQEKEIYDELNQIADLIQEYPDLVVLLDVPTLDTAERISILQKIIGEEQGITENFLCLLIEKRRFGRLAEIRNAFNMLYHEHFNIAEVFVTTAVPLEDFQWEDLLQKLHEKLGKNIILRESVDSSLIGGMIVQYGDTRMDNSVKSRMQEFAKQVSKH